MPLLFSGLVPFTSERWMSITATSLYGWNMPRWRWRAVRWTMPETSGTEPSPSSHESTSSGMNEIHVCCSHQKIQKAEHLTLYVLKSAIGETLVCICSLLLLNDMAIQISTTYFIYIWLLFLLKVQVHVHGGDAGKRGRLSTGVWALDGVGAWGAGLALLHQFWASLQGSGQRPHHLWAIYPFICVLMRFVGTEQEKWLFMNPSNNKVNT